MGTVGNYQITKKIAEGGFAIIYQAKHMLLDELACLKQCKVQSDDYNELLRQEAKILWKLSEHHSIPHAKDFMQAPDGSDILVLSYIDGKTIDDMIPAGKRIHSEDSCWIAGRLLEALYYCHYNGVVHSDIKPGNIIVEPKKHDIKLIDFGLSAYKPKSTTKPLGYTEAFVAPEIIDGKPPIPESDLYGAGLVLTYLLGGDPWTKTLPDHVPRELKEFCNDLTRFDPMQRPNWEKQNLVERLLEIRQHVFGRKHSEYYSKTKVD